MAHIKGQLQLETAKQIFQNSNKKFMCEGALRSSTWDRQI